MPKFNTYPDVTTLATADEFILWQSGAVKNITFANLASEILDEKTINAVWYAEISATTGTVSAPAGGTLIADRFASGVDALCSTITTLSPPDDEAATESDGTPVLVSSFTAGTGAYVLTGTPSSWPVALIIAYSTPLGDFDSTKALLPIFIDDTVTANEMITLLTTEYPDFVVTLGSDAAGDAPSQATIDSLVALGVKAKNVLYADTGIDFIFAINSMTSASTSDNITLASTGGGTFTIAAMDSASTIDNITIEEPATAVLWNPSDKSSFVTLSVGDTTAENGNGNWRAVRADTYANTGLRYVEFVCTNNTAGVGTFPGLANSSFVLDAIAAGSDSDSLAYNPHTGRVRFNNADVGPALAVHDTGDAVTVAIAWEQSTGKYWVAIDADVNVGGTEHGTMSGPLTPIGNIVGAGTPPTVVLLDSAADWLQTPPASYTSFGA